MASSPPGAGEGAGGTLLCGPVHRDSAAKAISRYTGPRSTPPSMPQKGRMPSQEGRLPSQSPKFMSFLEHFLQKVPNLRCFPLEPFFEINPGILCSGIGS